MSNLSPFKEFLDRFGSDPVLFVEEILKYKPQQWQQELLEQVALGTRKISVRSGHGCGKSAVVSWVMLWYLICRYPVKIILTAPSAAQVYDALFAECKLHLKNLPQSISGLLESTKDRIFLKSSPTEAFISARTSRQESPESLQGIHADWVLICCDEASGIPESVYEAGMGSMSGHQCTTILTSNPTRTSGFFYDTWHRNKSDWHGIHISCKDSPLVSQDYIEEMGRRYQTDSPVYAVRVLGDFPVVDSDAILALELVNSALTRDVEPTWTGSPVYGLDIARYGSDKSALCKRHGNVVLEEVKLWSKLDLMSLTGAVVNEYNNAKVKPAYICCDAIGLGAGVADALSEQGLPALAINVSAAPSFGERYENLRAELWFQAKEWFEQRHCRLPNDDRLISELTVPKYKFSSKGKYKVESKDEIKKRMGGNSPDAADAFILTFAAPGGALLAGGMASSWNQPLKRNLSVF